ncbi:hypothetical protein [Candidatus Enterococcus leclercqii]|uniref:hypothetical protein n=1 Tax=Candidatus Enterococcus leclercqii TaxID=1857218 RepID=UPI00137B76E1|nr:hypothetical protein [Enterococcus sp. CU9D]KAF1294215.1 hypothetical protein BAU14_07450 [Enterococcus sp. CU9D]
MICRYCNKKVMKLAAGQYHCANCELNFCEDQLIDSRSGLYREPTVETDPFFFQYTTTKELLQMTYVELLSRLKLARGVYRELRKKVYGHNSQADALDRENLKAVTSAKLVIENIMIEKHGYYPASVFESVIDKEVLKNRKQMREVEKKHG